MAEEREAELRVEEKALRDEFYRSVSSATQSSCLMENQCQNPGLKLCNDCRFRKGHLNKDNCLKKTRRCLRHSRECADWDTEVCRTTKTICKRKEMVCLKPRQVCVREEPSICLRYETKCVAEAGWAYDDMVWCIDSCGDHCHGSLWWSNPCCIAEGGHGREECIPNRCKEYRDECVEWAQHCVEWQTDCEEDMVEVCKESEQECAERGKECRRYESVCEEEVEECTKYEWVEEGRFCNDKGPNFGSCCSGCAGAQRISQTLGDIFKTSIELDQKKFDVEGGARSMELLTTLDIVSQNMEQIKAKIKLSTSRDIEDLADQQEEENLNVDPELDITMDLNVVETQFKQLSSLASDNAFAVESKEMVRNFLTEANTWTRDGVVTISRSDLALIQSLIKRLTKDQKRFGVDGESRDMELHTVMGSISQTLEFIKIKIERAVPNFKSDVLDIDRPTCNDNDSDDDDDGDYDCDHDLLSQNPNRDITLREDLNIALDLKVLKNTFPLQIHQLSIIASENPLAINSEKLMKKFLPKVDMWTKDGIVKKMSSEDITAILKFTESLQKELKVVRKEREKRKIDVSLEDPASGEVSLIKMGKIAESYISARSQALKISRKTELLSNVIIRALEEMASLNVEVDDYNKVIEYLVKCSKHLTKLRVAWGEIRQFPI